MTDEDTEALVRLLEDFKVKFGAMVRDYNAQVEQAVKTGTTLPDSKLFMVQRDQLVQNTIGKLQAGLSSAGVAKLDAHVQSEKHEMRVHIALQEGAQ